jgi:hypothetical protein
VRMREQKAATDRTTQSSACNPMCRQKGASFGNHHFPARRAGHVTDVRNAQRNL